MLIEALCDRWPDVFGESAAQHEDNMRTGQKPDEMRWEDWCDQHRKGYWERECHWYDPWYGREKLPGRHNGHCTGALPHNHQDRIMRWYWNPRTRVFTWPIILADELSESVADCRWFHRWVLHHTITHHDAQRPNHTVGSIAIHEQDIFQAPVKHDKCSCGEMW